MPVRSSRLARLARLGSLAAGVASEAVGAAGRATVGQAVAERFHREAAERIAEALGEMKGLPQKLGQVMGILDEALPMEHRAIYGEVLGRLQVAAEPLPWEEIAPVLESELGALGARFAELETTPAAAASIGQVHRAVLHDGRRVALKVQYPGVAEAVASDLANVGALVAALSSVLPRTSVAHLVAEVAATFREELDYRHEAEVQAAFAARWAGDPDLRIPAVLAEHSTRRVLCTQWADGLSFAAAREASDPLRGRWGGALWRFTWESVLRDHQIHGDPHPGNFLFREDGTVVVLDFGATATLVDPLVEGLEATARAAIAGAGDDAILDALLPALGLPRELDPEVAGAWAAFARLLMAPMAAPPPFRFAPAYVEALMAQVQTAKMAMAREALWKGMPTPRSGGVVVLMRTSVGQAAVLSRLEAAADYGAVVRNRRPAETIGPGGPDGSPG